MDAFCSVSSLCEQIMFDAHRLFGRWTLNLRLTVFFFGGMGTVQIKFVREKYCVLIIQSSKFSLWIGGALSLFQLPDWFWDSDDYYSRCLDVGHQFSCASGTSSNSVSFFITCYKSARYIRPSLKATD